MSAIPASAEAKRLIGEAIDDGRYGQARVEAERLLRDGVPDAELYALLGGIELNGGSYAMARRYLLEALRLAPDLPMARENLAYLDDLDLSLTDPGYIRQWLEWRVRHLEFPRVIHLETVGRCNAKCNFCPHPQLERRFDAMSDALFEKIVKEASGFPPDRFSGFAMHAVNEPFMDRKIFERMARINESVPHGLIAINTNMNVMPPRFFERIRRIRNISDWNVSFNAGNRAEYEHSMQVEFARTVANLRRLLEENRVSPFLAGPVNLSRVRTHDERDERFEPEVRELLSGFECGRDYRLIMLGRANWLGDIVQPLTRAMGHDPCHQWTNLTIHCNGIVPHCCVDARAQFPFGDVNRQDILDIYNSPGWRHLRQAVSCRDAVYPCRTCDLR